MLFFTKGAIRYTTAIPVAGDHVTNDIAIALRLPVHQAEKIKIKYACTISKSVVNNDEIIKLNSADEKSLREISRNFLIQVVDSRYKEIFELIRQELIQSGFEDLIVSGVVLTGGSSKMDGVIKLAENIFKMPVRLGTPRVAIGMNDILDNPIYATAVGLLQYGYNVQSDDVINNGNGKLNSGGKLRRLQQWFKNNF